MCRVVPQTNEKKEFKFNGVIYIGIRSFGPTGHPYKGDSDIEGVRFREV